MVIGHLLKIYPAMKGSPMENNARLSLKHLNIILIASAAIILSSSLEVLIRVKDSGLFEIWKENALLAGFFTQNNPPTFDDYVVGEMFRYMFRIIIPIGFSLFSYYTYKKLRLNRLFIFVWSVLLLGGMAYTFFELNFNSIFYYIVLIGFVVMLITVLSLNEEIRNNKNL